MSDERIVIRVSADGTINAETLGMRGRDCLTAITILEDLLEAETIQSSFTAAYAEGSQDQRNEGRDELHH